MALIGQPHSRFPKYRLEVMQETMGFTATRLAWVQVRVATAEDLRGRIADIERFTGEVGELTHFIKAPDKMHG